MFKSVNFQLTNSMNFNAEDYLFRVYVYKIGPFITPPGAIKAIFEIVIQLLEY